MKLDIFIGLRLDVDKLTLDDTSEALRTEESEEKGFGLMIDDELIPGRFSR